MAAAASRWAHPGLRSTAIPTLERLTGEERRDLFALGAVRQCRDGERICSKGDPGSQLFALLAGRLKLVTSAADGKHVTLAILARGELLGEVAAFDGSCHPATAVAIERSELLCVERRDFLSFLRKHPAAAGKVLAGMAAKMRWLSELVDDALFLDVPHRLARKLLRLAEQHGAVVDGRVRIGLKLSQRELGELVGASRESINKQLRSWRAQGILRTSDCHLELQRIDLLERMSDPLCEAGAR